MLLIIYYKKFNIILNRYVWIFDHHTKQRYGKFSNFYIFLPNSNILFKNHLVIILYNYLIKKYVKSLTYSALFKYFTESKITLKLTGLGYKFDYYTNKIIVLNIGHSHSIFIKIPKIVSYNLNKEKNNLILFSFNKLVLSLVASKIQSIKYPDPYKGNGIYIFKNVFED